ncbi:MAG TPA: hypothetical protein VIL74_03890 [Pyrinomonadaceae bacterium]|jgi:hypothetical protein
MSNRKNYNSIVFLTTLSVYLGLVLVGGATPSVLAQAALTRDFDIRNEVVIEDDLDKKPDDELFSALKIGSSKADKQFIERYAETILALLEKNRTPDFDGRKIAVTNSYSALADDAFFDGFFPAPRKDYVADGFDYTLDKDKLFGKLNLKSRFRTDASPAAYSFLSGSDSPRREAANKLEAATLNSTRIPFKNNQVFIVTRLPRASIDDSPAGK